MSQFVDHPNITAIVFHYYPGQKGGKAITDVLYGDVAPSGRLPFTIAKDINDYDLSSYFNLTSRENIQGPSVAFSSESLTAYRYFAYNKIEALYEFGFGLSYTNFEYVNLKVNKKVVKLTPLVMNTSEVLLESDANLYDQAVELAAEVKNVGSVDAKEVVQVCVIYPDSGTNKRPIRNLRGFENVDVTAGSEFKVTIGLNNKDLSVWNTEMQGWEVLKGTYTLSVGSWSRKLPLNGSITY